MTKNTRTTQGGYVLFLAVIVSTIIVTLGALIAGFVRHDLALAGASEQSDTAFYAATSAMNCARDYDLRGVFDISTALPSGGVICAGVSPTVSGSRASGQMQQYMYTWTTRSSRQTVCSIIQVIKTSSAGAVETRMIGRGYNASCGALSAAAVVERVVEIKY